MASSDFRHGSDAQSEEVIADYNVMVKIYFTGRCGRLWDRRAPGNRESASGGNPSDHGDRLLGS